MVIDEKGLVKAMKESWEGMGYKVAALDTACPQLMISGDGFCAIIQKEHVPRKALGMIAEHLGTLPEPGTAYQTMKGEEAQTEIFGLTMEAAENHFGAGEQTPEMSRTRVTLGGYEIWQRKDTLECRMIQPELRQILDNFGGRVRATPDGMTVEGEVSKIWISSEVTREADKVAMKHLSQVQWTA